MAMKKAAARKAAPKNTGASDKAKKAESARMTKAAAARKASGQTYIDKRGTGLGFPTDTAGFYAASPQSTKNLPMSAGSGKMSQKFGPYGKTAKRGVDQAKRADKKDAAAQAKSRRANLAPGASRVKAAKNKR